MDEEFVIAALAAPLTLFWLIKTLRRVLTPADSFIMHSSRSAHMRDLNRRMAANGRGVPPSRRTNV